MKPALLLIDLQEAFLGAPGLEPHRQRVVDAGQTLLSQFRRRGLPVVHVHTDTMPHWSTPRDTTPALAPAPGEPLVRKQSYSPFCAAELEQHLGDADTLVLAGLHLHACIRQAAIDAYQRGYKVIVVSDAVGSDDPLHAAVTRRYLERRLARFLELSTLFETPPATNGTLRLPAAVIDGERRDGAGPAFGHRNPANESLLWTAGSCTEISAAVAGSTRALTTWRHERPGPLLERLAEVLDRRAPRFEQLLVQQVGKPLRYARGEAGRAGDIVRAVAGRLAPATETAFRRTPLGVVALITPFNNPLAIPVGKLVPAVAYGNTVVWKPAPAGTAIALEVMECLQEAGFPPGVVNLIAGGRDTALELMETAGVDAVTISAGLEAGYAAQEICARRHVPLQAELGGNNAALVWPDTDLRRAAEAIAEGAFGFAGQRCTANRRAIVARACLDEFLEHLYRATDGLQWGDPTDPATSVGPLINQASLRRARAAARRAGVSPETSAPGYYLRPTVVRCPEPASEIAQEETFAPLLVVHEARNFEHGLELCNGVRQGLVAALFSNDPRRRQQFLDEARAGVLKFDRATADVALDVPFGGWKASGLGPPEHGPCNRDFYTRVQTVYPG